VKLREFERRVVIGSRFLTIAAVLGSLGGSLLMFFLGLVNIFEAFRYGMHVALNTDMTIPPEAAAVISVIEALDRFLIAIVLLYFAYGVYSLFVREQQEPELSIPQWLRVQHIGQLKQVVAEVIIVVLFVLFLRVALRAFQDPDLSLTWVQVAAFLLLPVATALLSLSLRLVALHPKPSSRSAIADSEASHDPGSLG
jgi:uncharacterized membrane protein YqhA